MSITRSCLVVLPAAAVLLSSCGADDGPDRVTGVDWQVTSVGDQNFDAPEQATTRLTLGASSFTGASGCIHFSGNVTWHGSGDSATVTLTDLQTTVEGDCGPADRYNADQLTDILGTPDLRWTVDDSASLREFRLWDSDSPRRSIRFSG